MFIILTLTQLDVSSSQQTRNYILQVLDTLVHFILFFGFGFLCFISLYRLFVSIPDLCTLSDFYYKYISCIVSISCNII